MTGAYAEYRIPTNALDVEILYRRRDGRSGAGSSCPTWRHTHRGPMRADGMDERHAPPFFPFLPDDGSAPVLLNRQEVVAFTVAAEADADLDDPRPRREAPEGHRGVRRATVRRRHRHRHAGGPPARPRTILNRPDPVPRSSRTGDRHHLIRKARITRILEIREK